MVYNDQTFLDVSFILVDVAIYLQFSLYETLDEEKVKHNRILKFHFNVNILNGNKREMGFPYSQISTLLLAQGSLCLLSFCCFAPAALKTAEQETLLHCSTLCLCFLSPLLSISWITSSSASSLYSDQHNKVPSSPFSLPAMQFLWHLALCINICLHQWLYCSETEAEGEEELCPHRYMCYCFLLGGDLGQHGGPPPSLAPPIPALNAPLLPHHASLRPTSLLLCHRPLIVLSPCFLSSLPSVDSISQTHAAYVPRSPQPPSSCFCSVSLHVSARPDLLFFLSST